MMILMMTINGLTEFTWLMINAFVTIVMVILIMLGCMVIGNIVTYMINQFKLIRSQKATPLVVEENDNTEYKITRDGYSRP